MEYYKNSLVIEPALNVAPVTDSKKQNVTRKFSHIQEFYLIMRRKKKFVSVPMRPVMGGVPFILRSSFVLIT